MAWQAMRRKCEITNHQINQMVFELKRLICMFSKLRSYIYFFKGFVSQKADSERISMINNNDYKIFFVL